MKESNRHGHPAQKLELRRLLKALVEDGTLTANDAHKLLHQAKQKDQVERHPLVTIAERGFHRASAPHDLLTLETLSMWLAKAAGLPYLHIDPLKIDVSGTTGLVTYAYASRYGILIVEASEEQATIATAEPFVVEWEEELSRMLRRKIVKVISNPLDISRYLLEFYALTQAVKRAFGKRDGGTITGTLNLEQMVELGRAGKLDANDRYVVNIVDWLLQYAFDQRASDIHLEPRRDESDVRFRIDGVLHGVYQLPTVVMGAVISRLKVLGRMDLAEKRRPQDGRIKTKAPTGAEVELRLSTMPTMFGEKLVMRIFDPDITVKTFEELGFSATELGHWNSMVSSPYGIILVTGPTGSGKTTTLYSTLKQLASPEVNVCTIEDPVEMVEPKFNQMQVHSAIGLDFASGVRNLLRQDPDIIMVGEIRDVETAEMAVQAALTGHLVFSTLHTNDAVSAIARLLEIGVPHYLINATVLGVVAQRLVRTLCSSCKASGSVEEDVWESLVNPWKIARTPEISRPLGCLECRETGYKGRTGIFEILVLTRTLRKLIKAETDIDAVRALAIKEGMTPLHICGAQKVCMGLTTVEEVFRVAGTGYAI